MIVSAFVHPVVAARALQRFVPITSLPPYPRRIPCLTRYRLMAGPRRSKRKAAAPTLDAAEPPEARRRVDPPAAATPEHPSAAAAPELPPAAATPELPATAATLEPPARLRLVPPTEAIPVPPASADYFKVMSYNVCSLRSMLGREDRPLESLVATYDPDVLCIQETKMTEEAVAKLEEPDVLHGYTAFWAHSTTAKGKHGVAMLVKKSLAGKSSRIEGPDDEIVCGEGRIVALDLATEQHGALTIVNSYVPNSGAKLARLPYRTETFEPALRGYLARLRKEKGAVLYIGDLNCAHEEVDIHNSKGNRKNAGHTPQECTAFSELLRPDGGYVDAYRSMNPNVDGAYTFWSKRSKTTRETNKGWRLDYAICSEEMFARVHDVQHLVHIDASDHCPVQVLVSKA